MDWHSLRPNFHTHTTFCDGADTPADNARAAIEKNMKILGFSAHVIAPFTTDWHIDVDKIGAYCAEVRRLGAAHKGALDVRLGFEADYVPGVAVPSFRALAGYAGERPDFVIGSVHYVCSELGTFAVDGGLDELKRGIQDVFGGDARAAACEYFRLEREMLQKGDFTIIGHADLIQKYAERERIFDDTAAWYRAELRALAAEIARAGVIAEINTGAIARGYRTSPYPSAELLALLHEARVPVMVNSDAHSARALDCAFDQAVAHAKNAGYTELAIPCAGGFSFYSI